MRTYGFSEYCVDRIKHKTHFRTTIQNTIIISVVYNYDEFVDLINQNDTNTSRKSFTENLSAVLQLQKKKKYNYNKSNKIFKDGNKCPHEPSNGQKTSFSETTMFNRGVAGQKTHGENSKSNVFISFQTLPSRVKHNSSAILFSYKIP